MEAHHVDLKSAGGARHAGNLILLCKLHHGNYGRRLTRTAVIAALQERAKDKTIWFDAAGGPAAKVKGWQIELVIPDTGESVNVFFTREHATFWIHHAKPFSTAMIPGNASVSPVKE